MIGKLLQITAFILFSLNMSGTEPERKTFTSGGFEREYLVYVPSSTPASTPTGIIVALHGFNGSMNSFFEEYAMTALADSMNYVIVAPQAIPEQNNEVKNKAELLEILGKKIPLNAVWGCGLRVIAELFTVQFVNNELNKDVDDVMFLTEVINQTAHDYSLSTDNIFLVGTSMGGYMAYQYALKQPVKIAGVVSIAGSMGINIKGKGEGKRAPVCDFHSETDEVVPYSGSYNQSGATIQLAQKKTDVINYWREANGAGTAVVEKVDYYPSTNNITVEKTTWSSDDNPVVHYKMNGSSHSYFFRRESGDCMDYVEEIGKFIYANSSSHNEAVEPQSLLPYPNPADNVVFFGCTTGVATVYDNTGRVWLSERFEDGRMDVSSLRRGMYYVRIQSDTQTQVFKLIKR